MNRLTIDHQRVSHVSLDVEALRLTHPKHSAVYAPFRQLRQVVCFGHIHWHGEALHACFVRDVQIQFFDKKGRLAAVSHSMGQAVDYDHPLLRVLLSAHAREALYAELQLELTQRLRSLLGAALCQRFVDDPQALWQFVSSCHSDPAALLEWDARVEALLNGEVLERLRALGLPAEVLYPAAGPQTSFLRMLTRLMLWPLRLQYPAVLESQFHAPLYWLSQPQRGLERDWQQLMRRLREGLSRDTQLKR